MLCSEYLEKRIHTLGSEFDKFDLSSAKYWSLLEYDRTEIRALI